MDSNPHWRRNQHFPVLLATRHQSLLVAALCSGSSGMRIRQPTRAMFLNPRKDTVHEAVLTDEACSIIVGVSVIVE
jgi:hypothetical protein